MTDDALRVPVELREVDSVDEATLENIWIAGQPVGILLKSLGERVATLETVVEELRDDQEPAEVPEP